MIKSKSKSHLTLTDSDGTECAFEEDVPGSLLVEVDEKAVGKLSGIACLELDDAKAIIDFLTAFVERSNG